jgi:hypothetical protein
MRRFKTALTVIGAVTVLVLAGNTVAFAATGGKFFLGKVNYANKQSTLVRTTSGPALKLATKYASNPPLATNGRGRVANLNADMVDGVDSAAMLNRTMVFESAVNTSATSGFTMTLPSIPAGAYNVTVAGWLYGPTSGSGFECYVNVASTSRSIEGWFPVNAQGFYGVNMVGVLRLTVAEALSLHCNGASGDYTSYAQAPMQISLSRIGSLSTGAGTLSRIAPSRVVPNASPNASAR